jgi:hypothetical protein
VTKASVHISIPADQQEQLLAVMGRLKRLYPQRTNELMDVYAQSRLGIVVTIEPMVSHHTDQQRGYYHMWKRAFADYTGNSPDEVHEHILGECFGTEYKRTMLGIMKRPLQRSSESSRTDYSQLIETLIRVAAEMGFTIPPPIVRLEEN